MGWVCLNVLIEKSRLWRWSKKERRAEGLCGNSWWVFSMAGGSACLFLSMFWKMSSALKDCQQVCEAGTLEGDRKRAFGLFFSPRNPAPLANPPTAEISLLHKSVRREEQNQTWKGPAGVRPQAWAQRALGAGREHAEQTVTTLPALRTKLLVEHWPCQPHSSKGTLSLQSLWFALEHVWHFHVASGCRCFSWTETARKIWGLTDLLTCKSRVIGQLMYYRHRDVWAVHVQTHGHPGRQVEALPCTKMCLVWKERVASSTGCSPWFKLKLYVVTGISSASPGFQGGLCVTRATPAKPSKPESFCSNVIKLMKPCRIGSRTQGEEQEGSKRANVSCGRGKRSMIN